MRNLAILAALILAGCSNPLGISGARNDFKGQPLSAVQVRLGPPEQQETFGGKKSTHGSKVSRSTLAKFES
jgi:hypothetical protein